MEKKVQETDKKLFIFILSYNHRKTIMALLDRIPKETWGRVSEVLIADDCSKDDTVERAIEYKRQKNLKKLTIIKHEKNKGYGGNQKFCYNYAISKGYDIAAMLHGDLQYPPEHILPLFNLFNDPGVGMVFGSRMTGKPLKGGMPLYKFLGNIFLTSVENIILRTRLSEFHSGFRLYSTMALKKIPFNKNSDNFHFDSEIITQMIIAKKKIAERPIPTFYGDEKCNVNSIKYGLNVLKVMSHYILHKTNLRIYEKFDIKNQF
ncbi:glycosyltransferase family 2 protein [Candidatus Pacearchaeota archaeon]|nr:glycosyltransferase family 2 protein [Candidatus Pacearchaeota archaeon]